MKAEILYTFAANERQQFMEQAKKYGCAIEDNVAGDGMLAYRQGEDFTLLAGSFDPISTDRSPAGGFLRVSYSMASEPLQEAV